MLCGSSFEKGGFFRGPIFVNSDRSMYDALFKRKALLDNFFGASGHTASHARVSSKPNRLPLRDPGLLEIPKDVQQKSRAPDIGGVCCRDASSARSCIQACIGGPTARESLWRDERVPIRRHLCHRTRGAHCSGPQVRRFPKRQEQAGTPWLLCSSRGAGRRFTVTTLNQKVRLFFGVLC